MSAKKGKSSSRTKGKKKKAVPVTPPADLPADPVHIAIQARKDEKYKRLELIHGSIEQVIHETQDKQEAHKLCQLYIKELHNEMEVDIKPYRVHRDEEYKAMKLRFAADATTYAEHMAATQRDLNSQHQRIAQKLTKELARVRNFREDLGTKLAELEYLQEVKEDQKNTIRRLKKQLDTAREEQAEEAQRIRLRHARHRLLDLEGREHRLEVVSEHLAKETLPYFVYRLEIKMDENRRLRSEVLKRVNEVKLLNKFRSELEGKEKMLTFDYQHLLKYKQNTQAMLKRLAISPVPRAIPERDFIMSPNGVRGWNWRQPSLAVLPIEYARMLEGNKTVMKSDDLNEEEEEEDHDLPFSDQQQKTST